MANAARPWDQTDVGIDVAYSYTLEISAPESWSMERRGVALTT
jgi:hypothetical protein